MFIVLEGSDGSGKTTQFKLLVERLRAAGHEVDVYDFPRYEEPSSYFVQRYLNGEYGPASEVSPYTASLFYALDRFEAAPQIRQSLAGGKIVLANRYTGSNMAHQGAKFSRPGEQRGFFVWADSLEFQLLGIPRPNINIFLRVPAETAYELIKKKGSRSYTDKIYDEHEADIEHLRQSVSAFDRLCQLFSKDFQAIDCTKNSKMLAVTEVNNRIWEVIKPRLPTPKHAGHPTTVSLIEKKIPPVKEAKPEGLDGTSEAYDTANTTTLKDVSLLTAHNLIGQGLDVDYKLEWPPSAKPRLNYFIPADLPPELLGKYRSTMARITENCQKIDRALPPAAKKYARRLTPLATLVDAALKAGHDEVKTNQVRETTSQPQAIKQIIDRMAKTNLGVASDDFKRQVNLITATPKNEFDVLADYLYQQSNLTRDEITAQIDSWTYEQKAGALKEICGSDSQFVLSLVNYRFDVLDNLIDLTTLAKMLASRAIQIQPPTVRFGYQVPEVVEEAGVEGLFIDCFDLSLGLYSDLQAAGLEELAGYVVLTGHRQRWQFKVDGEHIFLPKHKIGVIQLLKEQIAETHPLISSAVKEAITNKTRAGQKNHSRRRENFQKSSRKRRAKSKK